MPENPADVKERAVQSDENEVNMSKAITKFLVNDFSWNFQEKIAQVFAVMCEIFRQIDFV